MGKVRADELLVIMGEAESRSFAQRLILAGQVSTLTQVPVAKPSQLFESSAQLVVRELPRYVGRGGEKLEGFFKNHHWNIEGKHGLDVGASTGGFTDYLLQHGAASVVCIDVGHGQLHYKLRNDGRVTNLEKVNARALSQHPLPRKYFDVIVVDLSFISLKKILPEIWKFLDTDGLLVALVKPQFEATKEEANRGRGIIGDESIHRRICGEIRGFALGNLPGCAVAAEMASPLRGGDGNREFFLGLRRKE